MKKRRVVLVFLVAIAVITFLDRICLSVAGPRIQDELHITPERWGWITGAYVLAYALFEIPTGAFGDRHGRRNVITRIGLWWSACTALSGAAIGFPMLFVTRFVFGAGEAGIYPNIAGVVARWFPVKEHARTQGFLWAACRFGGALSPLLIVPTQAFFGWRATFWVLGVIGAAWSLLWFLWYHEHPRDQPGITAAELAEIPPPAPIKRILLPWSTLWRSSQMWCIVSMYFCQSWSSWFYFAWFPTYLVKGAGFSEREMGIFSALPYLAGTFGNVAGGFLSDRLVLRRGLRLGRLLPGSMALATSAALMLTMSLTHNKAGIVVLSTLGFGIADLMLPVAWAICLDIGRDYAGVVTATMNTAGQLGGFVCAVMFGYLVKATGSYNKPLWIISSLVMLSAFLFSRIDATRPLVPITAEPQSGELIAHIPTKDLRSLQEP